MGLVLTTSSLPFASWLSGHAHLLSMIVLGCSLVYAVANRARSGDPASSGGDIDCDD